MSGDKIFGIITAVVGVVLTIIMMVNFNENASYSGDVFASLIILLPVAITAAGIAMIKRSK